MGDSRTERAVTVAGYTVDENVKTAVISDGNVEITFTYTANGPEVDCDRDEYGHGAGPTTTNVVTQTGTPGTTTTPGAATTPGTTTTPEATTPETTPTEEPIQRRFRRRKFLWQRILQAERIMKNRIPTTIEDEEVPLADKELKKDNSKWILFCNRGRRCPRIRCKLHHSCAAQKDVKVKLTL